MKRGNENYSRWLFSAKGNIRILLISAGFVIFGGVITSLLFVNFHFGFAVILACACFLMLYGMFFERLIKLKLLNRGVLTVSVFFMFMMLFIGIYGRIDNVTFDEDAVIVLGAGIRGERVSRSLSYRLDKAAEYSAENPKAVIVVSGGQGPQEDITEALAMERYLIGKGIPREKILKEEKSTSTYENILFSKEILDDLFEGPYETVVITNDFHIFRAAAIAGKLGLNVKHSHAKIEWYSIPVNYSRECAAIFKYWLLGV